MIIGDRLCALREDKKLSQGDIEKGTGLLRCYISRVESGHTVPALETLEKMARALEIPIYQLFHDGDEPPQVPILLKRRLSDDNLWGVSGKDEQFLRKLRHLLGKSDEGHRKLLLHMPRKWLVGSCKISLARTRRGTVTRSSALSKQSLRSAVEKNPYGHSPRDAVSSVPRSRLGRYTGTPSPSRPNPLHR